MTIIDTNAAAALFAVVALAVMLGLVAVTLAMARTYAAQRPVQLARPSLTVHHGRVAASH